MFLDMHLYSIYIYIYCAQKMSKRAISHNMPQGDNQVFKGGFHLLVGGYVFKDLPNKSGQEIWSWQRPHSIRC